MTVSETRGFVKVLIDTQSDRILGFTMFGASAGEVMTTVQMVMLAGLPYTALRDAIIAHPTMPEGLASPEEELPLLPTTSCRIGTGSAKNRSGTLRLTNCYNKLL
jgi:hypothetical protein